MSTIKEENLIPQEWEKFTHDFETMAIKSSRTPESFASKPMVVPIFSSALFAMDAPSYEDCFVKDGHKPYFHGRKGNPTRNALENSLATIEGAKYALTFASGCAATNTLLQSILEYGSHVVATETIYGGTAFMLQDFKRFGISVDFDNSFDPEIIGSLVKDSTKIVWLETPANPTMNLIDIRKTAEIVKSKNPNTLLVVDNTFLTPIYQRPLELGAHITMHSCSKYINGHADIFMGSLACNDDKIYEILRNGQETYGAIPSPYDCYNLIRSLKTLPLRMQQHCKNGNKVARFLEKHPCVLKVIYPGLESHPQHKIALKQQSGNCGAIGVYLKGGLHESYTFLKSLKVVMGCCPSIGTDFSVANLPCKLSHWEIEKDIRDRLGITENFIRLSVGLENAEVIIEDLNQALLKAIKI